MFQNRVFRADTRNYTRNLETTRLSLPSLVRNSFPPTDFQPISSSNLSSIIDLIKPRARLFPFLFFLLSFITRPHFSLSLLDSTGCPLLIDLFAQRRRMEERGSTREAVNFDSRPENCWRAVTF